ncbi:MAG TPA: hypothetical protein DCQ26_00550 [Marinilabiliales bacterium]|jgi:hypothetical protein|nr:hypothetical protein [Salinivirgaceae bacterium]OFX63778.1 MAG: hypothetical protein A2W84_17085 [Bacteroidetes bacterium GWC2_40_13]OFX75186.1 MAG: hypothetical protein A2W96_16430 [Bacteroidetes bacterium GWD2_40_43]OFX89783.1 MAG: hypothetical protein A2W97_12090 [Bacteroidetes bacterium GWE2_40_63]OFY22023.1 MAG: hypothetical protein A2W88_00755 [Bacteroidetes bacterium GWF2_40_13]OFZ26082.1 MAG: hypothetical protein A2437_10415 [Bacteroidetes bacterium RIFOXYC2_FULL_40_12]HAM97078.1 h
MKTVIQIVLGISIVVLSYFLVESIMKPIRFKKEQTHRYSVVIQNLKDIRTAQLAYKDVYGKFTGSFDTLINFVKHDSLVIIKKIGEIDEDLLGKITEKEAIAQGLIKRDTIRVNVLDSIFADNFAIDSLRYIPFSDGKQFNLAAGEVVTGSKLKVKVFEAKAPSKYILQGMNKQMVINLNDGLEYPGLKVGSLIEANNAAGNWE